MPQLPAQTELLKVVPGFGLDADEDWMYMLKVDDQNYLRQLRASYVDLTDRLDTLRGEHLRTIDQNRKNKDLVRQLQDEFKANKLPLNDELKQLINRSLPKVRRLRDEAIRLKRKRNELDLEELKKKRKTENANNTFEINIDDAELVPDDYLPKYTSVVQEEHRPSSRVSENSGPFTTPVGPSKPTQEVDPFLLGVEPEDKEILKELRPLIVKYDCRDRVLNTIEAFRARDRCLKALEIVEKTVPIMLRQKQ